ncbi:hypothetical protein BCR36DRAFT_90221 [Piromyces finnis]|uniref:Uncharacterized protein n=1 Tax=Piromyces finnis TaxID=1754191 RepID=A0A1Y1VMA2_9FUNG|nr:hypothetical protein BCR36DRAFT_90221 [Piromyces finnis]|eukprot:ORX59275.1 hypothetical protein BCR36DRAFT_90221 [Piromyces finnis]
MNSSIILAIDTSAIATYGSIIIIICFIILFCCCCIRNCNRVNGNQPYDGKLDNFLGTLTCCPLQMV